MGLAAPDDDPQSSKKQQLFVSFKGDQWALAEEAISDLLDMQPHAT
jgi:hypothetical protein